MAKQAKSRYGKQLDERSCQGYRSACFAATAASTDDCRCEQRMELGNYAVATLLFAVPQIGGKSYSSRKRLKKLALNKIIRRSPLPIREFTLLITLLCEGPGSPGSGWRFRYRLACSASRSELCMLRIIQRPWFFLHMAIPRPEKFISGVFIS